MKSEEVFQHDQISCKVPAVFVGLFVDTKELYCHRHAREEWPNMHTLTAHESIHTEKGQKNREYAPLH